MRREGDFGSDAAGGPTGEDLGPLAGGRRRRLGLALSLVVLAVILIAFVAENSARVEISFVFFSREVRPIWLMLVCAGLGGIVGFLLGRPGKQLRFGRKDRGSNGPDDQEHG